MIPGQQVEGPRRFIDVPMLLTGLVACAVALAVGFSEFDLTGDPVNPGSAIVCTLCLLVAAWGMQQFTAAAGIPARLSILAGIALPPAILLAEFIALQFFWIF